MKIALITDQHFGIRNDSQLFVEYQRKFYETLFFPTLKDRGITTIIDLGDTFDRRKYINYHTLLHIKDFYFDRLRSEGIKLHIIIGNHSTYHKNTNDVNSPDLVLREYDNVISYKNPVEVDFGGTSFLMMPWINSENQEQCFEAIKKSKSPVMFGHFELAGHTLRGHFKFNKGIQTDDIKKFEYVFSGHYHHKTQVKNFYYLGAPYQFDWGDLDERRGFYIFDTDTRELEFIENPSKIYKKFIWSSSSVENISAEDVEEKYVRVVVKEKGSQALFDQFITELESYGPHNIVIDEFIHNFSEEECNIESLEDTLSTIKKYVQEEALDDEIKSKLIELIIELYNESLNID